MMKKRILEILKETLSDSGYHVDTAAGRRERFAVCSAAVLYDLALCDWEIMPGLNGQQVYERYALRQSSTFRTNDFHHRRCDQ